MAYPAPNGRELAIEALLDREPNGDAYRVSRVLVRTTTWYWKWNPLLVESPYLMLKVIVILFTNYSRYLFF